MTLQELVSQAKAKVKSDGIKTSEDVTITATIPCDIVRLSPKLSLVSFFHYWHSFVGAETNSNTVDEYYLLQPIIVDGQIKAIEHITRRDNSEVVREIDPTDIPEYLIIRFWDRHNGTPITELCDE